MSPVKRTAPGLITSRAFGRAPCRWFAENNNAGLASDPQPKVAVELSRRCARSHEETEAGGQGQSLVTGAGGFIGHHLVTYLQRYGYWVRGVDIKPPEYRRYRRRRVRTARSAALG